MDIFTPRRSASQPSVTPSGPTSNLPTLRVLVVCTADISRSPLAAGIMQQQFQRSGIASTVTSAGTRSTQLPVDHLSVAVGDELGIPLADHQPRKLTTEILASEGSNLVVGMAREHLREIVLVERDAWSRSFTMKELVRLAERSPMPSTGFDAWLRSLSTLRRPHDLLGDDADDDIEDTFGTSLQVHRQTANELISLTERFIGALNRGSSGR